MTTEPQEKPYYHRIRSFVKRESRLTAGQQRALDEQWPIYGMSKDQGMCDLDVVFGRNAKRIFEIGFGNGELLATVAERDPEIDYIGVEVHAPGVGHLLIKVKEAGLSNVRVFQEDAVEVLEEAIPEQALDGVCIFFPDPWHKKRHFKRRLVQPAFVETLASRIKPGGFLHIATDWQDYAEHCLEVLAGTTLFENTATEGDYVPRPTSRPETKYERRGINRGHDVFDILYKRV